MIDSMRGTQNDPLQSLEIRVGELDSPAAALLLASQQVRGHLVNPYLNATADLHAIKLRLDLALSRATHVVSVLNAKGDLRAFAILAEHDVAVDDPTGMFMYRHGRHSLEFVVPNPRDSDAAVAAIALADALEPSTDQPISISVPIGSAWCEGSIIRSGFMSAAVESIRPPLKLSRPPRPPEEGFSIRLAGSLDLNAIVELMTEEYAYHTQFHPVARHLWSPECFVPTFRRTLESALADAGSATVFVTESADGSLAGMLYLRTRRIVDPTNPLPIGLHVMIQDISVRATMQGRGLGRNLIEATQDAFAQESVVAFGLAYTADNPIARRLWPHLGFRAHRRTYVRTAENQAEPI